MLKSYFSALFFIFILTFARGLFAASSKSVGIISAGMDKVHIGVAACMCSSGGSNNNVCFFVRKAATPVRSNTFNNVEADFRHTVQTIMEGDTKVSKLPNLAFNNYANEQVDNLQQCSSP